MDPEPTCDPCDCKTTEWLVTSWPLVVITVLTTLWGGVNEYLSYRRGNRNAQATCVGDCVRIAFNGKIKRDEDALHPEDLAEQRPVQESVNEEQERAFSFQMPDSWKIAN